jgi:hypothetical protein
MTIENHLDWCIVYYVVKFNKIWTTSHGSNGTADTIRRRFECIHQSVDEHEYDYVCGHRCWQHSQVVNNTSQVLEMNIERCSCQIDAKDHYFVRLFFDLDPSNDQLLVFRMIHARDKSQVMASSLFCFFLLVRSSKRSTNSLRGETKLYVLKQHAFSRHLSQAVHVFYHSIGNIKHWLELPFINERERQREKTTNISMSSIENDWTVKLWHDDLVYLYCRKFIIRGYFHILSIERASQMELSVSQYIDEKPCRVFRCVHCQ